MCSSDLASTPLPTTPRRSRRFQPNVTRGRSPISRPETDAWISGAPTHSRCTTHEDMIPEDEEDVKDIEDLETMFHGQFIRRSQNRGRAALRTYSRKASSSRTQEEGKDETFKIGDTVLVATDPKKPSVGVIITMWEIRSREESADVPRMRVRVHWFLRPTELPQTRAKRNHFQNEVYYSLDRTSPLSTSSIISHCTITDQPDSNAIVKSAAAWSVSPSKRQRISDDGDSANPDAGEKFYCGIAVDSQRGLFYELDWRRHRDHALSLCPETGGVAEWGTGSSWRVSVEIPKKTRSATLRKIDEERDGDDDDDEYKADNQNVSDHSDSETLTHDHVSEDDESAPTLPRTPSKKRKRTFSTPTKPRTNTTPRSTPRKRTRSIAQPTPHSKAALRRRARKVTVRAPPPELVGNVEQLPRDPYLRAMHILHVAARPEALPCREEEYQRIMRSVEELLEEGSGGCIYISGVPGTGKTATVHAVVRQLKRMAEQNEVNPFTYVEINGLRIPEPSAAYGLLWEAVSGHDAAEDGRLRISSKEALNSLTKHFSSGGRMGPRGHACIVLMDELDQLMTTKQDVVYNFFNWPTLVGSKIVVIAVANTMDLPERVMTGRVRSRLGMIRINFQPYTTQQLEKIVRSRLEIAKEDLESGPVDVISPDGVKFASMKVSSISGDARRVLDICRRTVELVRPLKRVARTEDVKEVIKIMQNSPTAAYLRDCSFHERLMLAALLKCMKKEGVEQIKWSDIQYQHCLYQAGLAGDDDSTRNPTPSEFRYILDSLLASRALLIEDGALSLKKPDGERRLILNLEQAEVERVLGDVGGSRWKNALSVS